MKALQSNSVSEIVIMVGAHYWRITTNPIVRLCLYDYSAVDGLVCGGPVIDVV